MHIDMEAAAPSQPGHSYSSSSAPAGSPPPPQAKRSKTAEGPPARKVPVTKASEPEGPFACITAMFCGTDVFAGGGGGRGDDVYDGVSARGGGPRRAGEGGGGGRRRAGYEAEGDSADEDESSQASRPFPY